jgi:hypothetical protein
MRFAAFALSAGLVLARASDPMEKAMDRFDSVQLGALALVGPFLQQNKLPAPWMKYLQGNQLRRLDAHSMTKELPAACKAACPNLEAMMKGLEQKMMSAMIPHMAAMQEMQGSSGSGASQGMDDMAKMMEAMMPMLKAILQVTFDDMCVNKDSYVCMVANMEKCQEQSATGTVTMPGMSYNDPVAMAKDYGPQLNCFCDTCPGARKAYTDMSVTTMSVMMNAFTSMASGMGGAMSGESTTSTELPAKIKTDMMNAVCPLVGMTRCFDQNPTECGSMMKGTTTQGIGSMGLNATAIPELTAECDKGGISVRGTPLSKVSTMVKIQGLDFDKVNSNEEIKANLIGKIKAEFLKKLKGYTADDLTVTLSAGSVQATVAVTPMPGSSSTLLESAMKTEKDAIATAVLAEVKAMPTDTLSTILQSDTTAEQLAVTADAPVVAGASPASVSASYEVGAAGIFWSLLVQVMISA